MATERPLELRIAGVHLRNGALGLARAELEAAAGRGALDEDALLDLAEARWRTGDLSGAGEVANAYLATGRRHALALVVAAEAVAAVGRPGEARRLAASALAAGDLDLDAIFAGMPRSLVWPPERPPDAAGANPGANAPVVAPPPTVSAPRSGPVPPTTGQQEAVGPSPGVLPDAATALDAGRAAVAAGRFDLAAMQLAIALRLDPSLAPAVLDAAGTATAPALDLVRGDAFRAAGRETQARHAYSSALRALGEGGDTPPPGPS